MLWAIRISLDGFGLLSELIARIDRAAGDHWGMGLVQTAVSRCSFTVFWLMDGEEHPCDRERGALFETATVICRFRDAATETSRNVHRLSA